MRALVRAFYYVPVIGWLVKDAVHGSPEARYFFLANMLAALAALIYTFGYPLVITLALIGTGLGLSWVILLSMGDVIERLLNRRAARATAIRRDAPIAVELARQAA